MPLLNERQFLVYYLLFLNLYGNLFIVAGGMLLFLICFWPVWYSFLGLLAIPSICIGFVISFKFPQKYKYYRVTFEKIRRNGFKEEYFLDGFIDPCYRIISYKILKDFNFGHKYKYLKVKFGDPLSVLKYKNDA